MAVEGRRGCGYRKVGGLYLVTDAGTLTLCDRMPIKLESCKHCEEMGFHCGFKPARGFTWVIPEKILGGNHTFKTRNWLVRNQLCPEDNCAVCRPELMGDRAGLLWINTKHYTPGSFISEAAEMGMSRRIAAIPRGFKVGETWVMFAQRDRGIFLALRPTRLEKLVKMSEYDAVKDKLLKQGITPIRVPDSDKDHK